MPSLSERELDALLRRHACRLIREGAKHELWWSPITDKTFVVPRRLKGEGTLRSILRDAGIKHPKYER
jgi:mRNA interferase HicA